MKKAIFGSAILLSAFIITFLNVSVINKKNIKISVNEPVLAVITPDYVLQNKACPGGGLYARCYPLEGSECDVSAQTLCD